MLASLSVSTTQRAAGALVQHEGRRQLGSAVAATAVTGVRQQQRSRQQSSSEGAARRRRRPLEPAAQLHRLHPSMLLKGRWSALI